MILQVGSSIFLSRGIGTRTRHTQTPRATAKAPRELVGVEEAGSVGS